MESWVLERLQEFVGRNDRGSLEPRVQESLTFQAMGDQSSYRVAKELPSLTRGLVVTEEGVVPDYSRVRRVFHLTNAITKYYYSPFFLEVQVPGYHARVAWLGGRQVGFTRDGRYCAFTSDRAPDFVPDRFFQENPNLVVCLAIEGKGIPYAKPSYSGEEEDIVAWGTEILEQGIREPMATQDKYDLFEKYGIKAAEHVGPYEAADVDKIVDWMKEVEASGHFGVVLKPSERHHRPLKFALPSALMNDVPAWLGLDNTIDEDPYFERLLQAACGAAELGRAPEDWDWDRVGKAVFARLAGVVRHIDDGGDLTSEHSVWLHHEGAAKELLAQLEERTPGTSIKQLELAPENAGWRLRFERRYAEATAGMQRRLSGASYRD